MSFARRIAVLGLGYVGLPLAVAFGRKRRNVIGFDIDLERIEALRRGVDWTHEVDSAALRDAGIDFTGSIESLRDADIFIVCVPTPIHDDHTPDLRPLQTSSEIIGKVMRKGAVVIYEATVYPGLTEEYCRPILERVSGLKGGTDFHIGYSPERINPGDKAHTFERIKKVVAADDEATAQFLAALYGEVVEAGIHIAPSIMVAEAAKVIENTQRDINIALMNELAVICDLLGIRTKDVLDAANTKWNFLDFSPGLVGGHCIGVDPYYLTSKAQKLGYHPDVILAGRRINDAMGSLVADRLARFLGVGASPLCRARVGIFGITFKENVSDIRNSRVPDIVKGLKRFGISSLLHDPHADTQRVAHEYALDLCDFDDIEELDALVLAVPHAHYLRKIAELLGKVRAGGIFVDVKSAVDPRSLPGGLRYWSL